MQIVLTFKQNKILFIDWVINFAISGPYAEEEPQEDHLDRALPQVVEPI